MDDIRECSVDEIPQLAERLWKMRRNIDNASKSFKTAIGTHQLGGPNHSLAFAFDVIARLAPNSASMRNAIEYMMDEGAFRGVPVTRKNLTWLSTESEADIGSFMQRAHRDFLSQITLAVLEMSQGDLSKLESDILVKGNELRGYVVQVVRPSIVSLLEHRAQIASIAQRLGDVLDVHDAGRCSSIDGLRTSTHEAFQCLSQSVDTIGCVVRDWIAQSSYHAQDKHKAIEVALVSVLGLLTGTAVDKGAADLGFTFTSAKCFLETIEQDFVDISRVADPSAEPMNIMLLCGVLMRAKSLINVDVLKRSCRSISDCLASIMASFDMEIGFLQETVGMVNNFVDRQLQTHLLSIVRSLKVAFVLEEKHRSNICDDEKDAWLALEDAEQSGLVGLVANAAQRTATDTSRPRSNGLSPPKCNAVNEANTIASMMSPSVKSWWEEDEDDAVQPAHPPGSETARALCFCDPVVPVEPLAVSSVLPSPTSTLADVLTRELNATFASRLTKTTTHPEISCLWRQWGVVSLRESIRLYSASLPAASCSLTSLQELKNSIIVLLDAWLLIAQRVEQDNVESLVSIGEKAIRDVILIIHAAVQKCQAARDNNSHKHSLSISLEDDNQEALWTNLFDAIWFQVDPIGAESGGYLLPTSAGSAVQQTSVAPLTQHSFGFLWLGNITLRTVNSIQCITLNYETNMIFPSSRSSSAESRHSDDIPRLVLGSTIEEFMRSWRLSKNDASVRQRYHTIRKVLHCFSKLEKHRLLFSDTRNGFACSLHDLDVLPLTEAIVLWPKRQDDPSPYLGILPPPAIQLMRTQRIHRMKRLLGAVDFSDAGKSASVVAQLSLVMQRISRLVSPIMEDVSASAEAVLESLVGGESSTSSVNVCSLLHYVEDHLTGGVDTYRRSDIPQEGEVTLMPMDGNPLIAAEVGNSTLTGQAVAVLEPSCSRSASVQTALTEIESVVCPGAATVVQRFEVERKVDLMQGLSQKGKSAMSEARRWIDDVAGSSEIKREFELPALSSRISGHEAKVVRVTAPAEGVVKTAAPLSRDVKRYSDMTNSFMAQFHQSPPVSSKALDEKSAHPQKVEEGIARAMPFINDSNPSTGTVRRKCFASPPPSSSGYAALHGSKLCATLPSVPVLTPLSSAAAASLQSLLQATDHCHPMSTKSSSSRRPPFELLSAMSTSSQELSARYRMHQQKVLDKHRLHAASNAFVVNPVDVLDEPTRDDLDFTPNNSARYLLEQYSELFPIDSLTTCCRPEDNINEVLLLCSVASEAKAMEIVTHGWSACTSAGSQQRQLPGTTLTNTICHALHKREPAQIVTTVEKENVPRPISPSTDRGAKRAAAPTLYKSPYSSSPLRPSRGLSPSTRAAKGRGEPGRATTTHWVLIVKVTLGECQLVHSLPFDDDVRIGTDRVDSFALLHQYGGHKEFVVRDADAVLPLILVLLNSAT